MKTLNLVALVLAIVLFLSWASVAFYPSVRDYMDSNPFWNGLSSFNNAFSAKPIDGLGELGNADPEKILVEIPYTPYRDEELARIKSFVQGGGTLLLMDDYADGNQVLEYLGLDMRFNGYPLLDPFIAYRNKWLPLATDFPEWVSNNGVGVVSLNAATALDYIDAYEVLAESSDTSYVDLNGNETFEAGDHEGPLVVAAQADVGLGKVIAVADPSIAINGMLGREDNRQFLATIMSFGMPGRQIYVDSSHLPKSPLDGAKFVWQSVRNRMNAPYAQILLVGFVLAAVWVPFRGKGDKFEQEV